MLAQVFSCIYETLLYRNRLMWRLIFFITNVSLHLHHFHLYVLFFELYRGILAPQKWSRLAMCYHVSVLCSWRYWNVNSSVVETRNMVASPYCAFALKLITPQVNHHHATSPGYIFTFKFLIISLNLKRCTIWSLLILYDTIFYELHYCLFYKSRVTPISFTFYGRFML